MVELTSPQLDAVFHAVSDPTRRQMLLLLATSDLSIGELAKPFAMSLEGASKHVRVLERAGLVQRQVVGRTHLCRLVPEPLSAADRWLRFSERFWTGRVDALEAALRAEDEDDRKKDKQ